MHTSLKYLLSLGVILSFVLAPLGSQAVTTTSFNPGDLIKGSLSTVYYFTPTGKRLVFPNEKTYFTWYSDFSTVKTIPDNILATIPLGGNVTYRPGIKLVKITSDPKVYAVERGGTLRHVTAQDIAIALYGSSWNYAWVEDVPDGFFVNYTVGAPILVATDFDPRVVAGRNASISMDKGMDDLRVNVIISRTADGFVPRAMTVRVGAEVTWTNNDQLTHTIKSSGTGAAAFDSGVLEPGQTFKRTFGTFGTFDYHDTLHPEMQGTITVIQ